MRYSQLFGKTLRQAPKEAKIASHQLLIKAGLIDRALASGIYSYLPLGFKVLKKIEQIIREEMNAIGGQEIYLPTLHPQEFWQETGRWQSYQPPLFKTQDQHSHHFCLAPTHEEVITDLCRRLIKSYRDLPSAVYQFQNKFRNETRATGGLLRVREFMMKDLYSFHADEKDLDQYYQKVYQAYEKIFQRCDLQAVAVEASSGSIGGSFNHEFMVFAKAGEDKVAVCSQCEYKANLEVAADQMGEEEVDDARCDRCQKGKLKVQNAIELGHVFKLGTKYSEDMGAKFLGKDGKKKLIVMGCYGIGLGRLMATVVEAHHDKKGLVWPASVAPFQAHLLSLQKNGDEVYQKLVKAGVGVLYDDRVDVSAGVKFADADLIGIPVRLVVSDKTKAKVEWKKRDSEKTEILDFEQVVKRVG